MYLDVMCVYKSSFDVMVPKSLRERRGVKESPFLAEISIIYSRRSRYISSVYLDPGFWLTRNRSVFATEGASDAADSTNTTANTGRRYARIYTSGA